MTEVETFVKLKYGEIDDLNFVKILSLTPGLPEAIVDSALRSLKPEWTSTADMTKEDKIEFIYTFLFSAIRLALYQALIEYHSQDTND